MLYEKKVGKRHRVLEFVDNDYYVTGSDVKFPIKTKPMVFSDLHTEYNNFVQKLSVLDQKRLAEDPEFDIQEFIDTTKEYLNSFYEIVKLVTDFNGYKVDEEFIKANMGYEDPYWYMQSVSLGRPVYCVEDYEVKKKK